MFENSEDPSALRQPALESQILRDLREKTGYEYSSLNDISVDDSTVAEKVFGVLASWVDIIPYSNYRSFIYFLFGKNNRCARAWFNDMLRWWQLEAHKIGKGQLSQLIAYHTHDEDCRRVWELTKNADFPGDCLVFARLATIPPVSSEVIERILSDLNQGKYVLGDLHIYAKLPDVRIRRWIIEEGRKAPNRRVREFARRLAQKTIELPAWLRLAPGPPPREAEVHSAEVELNGLDRATAKIARQLGIEPRKIGRTKTFLAFADDAQWFVGEFGPRGEEVLDLWLRAEDHDIVEVVITRRRADVAEASSKPRPN